MNALLTATIADGGAPGARHRAVLATTPERLRPVDEGGDVAMVVASGAGWTTRLVETVHRGARGVLVVDVGASDGPDDIRAAIASTAEAGVVVVVDRPCVMHRAWRQVSADWRRDAAKAALLDSAAASIDRLDVVLLEQLALVHAAVGRPDHLDAGHRSASAYQIAGRAGSVRISLAAAPGPIATLAVDLLGVGIRRQARFAGTDLAAPPRIAGFDRTGAHTEPPRYESGHRAAWLELHAAVTAPDRCGPGTDLDRLAEDVAWVHQLLGRDQRRVSGDTGTF